MVTHDLEYLKYANRAIKIFDGRVQATYTESQINDLMGSSQQKRGVGVAEKVLSEQYAKVPEVTEKPAESAVVAVPPVATASKHESAVATGGIKYAVESIDEPKHNALKSSQIQKKT